MLYSVKERQVREQQVQEAIRVLRDGGIVAYPTDTVYGLGANGLDATAVRRVFTAKRRPLTMAVPLLVADMDMLRSCAISVTEPARLLAERFLPGPLTLVLSKAPIVPDVVTAGSPTVALRIPDHPVPRALAAGIGAPLVGTSANRSGLPSQVTAEEVRAELGDEVDMVIEGTCRGGVESTIVDCTGAAPRVLRVGAISLDLIEETLGMRVAR